LSWAATTAFAFKFIGWSASSEIPSILHTLMVRSLTKGIGIFHDIQNKRYYQV
jgi:hypothetical protein